MTRRDDLNEEKPQKLYRVSAIVTAYVLAEDSKGAAWRARRAIREEADNLPASAVMAVEVRPDEALFGQWDMEALVYHDADYHTPITLGDVWPKGGAMSPIDYTPWMERVLANIREERARQVEKFGDQSGRRWDLDPDEIDPEWYMTRVGDHLEHVARVNMASRSTWANILGEEVGEVLQEGGDPDALRKELVQMAAVAVAAIEAIDRKRDGSAAPEPEKP